MVRRSNITMLNYFDNSIEKKQTSESKFIKGLNK